MTTPRSLIRNVAKEAEPAPKRSSPRRSPRKAPTAASSAKKPPSSTSKRAAALSQKGTINRSRNDGTTPRAAIRAAVAALPPGGKLSAGKRKATPGSAGDAKRAKLRVTDRNTPRALVRNFLTTIPVAAPTPVGFRAQRLAKRGLDADPGTPLASGSPFGLDALSSAQSNRSSLRGLPPRAPRQQTLTEMLAPPSSSTYNVDLPFDAPPPKMTAMDAKAARFEKMKAARRAAIVGGKEKQHKDAPLNDDEPMPAHLRLPASLTKKLFTSFTKFKVEPTAIDAVRNATDDLFKQMADDLAAFAKHGRRKTIEKRDLEALFHRQRHTGKKQALSDLLHDHLPMEFIEEIVPVAKAKGRR